MIDYLDKLNQVRLEKPVNADEISFVEKDFHFTFPKQYKEFLLLHNGGEGPVGEYGYIAIFGLEELISSNGEDKINDYHPELFYFASDRGGMIYAFDMSVDKKPIVELPGDSVDYDDVEIVAGNFNDFVNYIYNIDDSEFD